MTLPPDDYIQDMATVNGFLASLDKQVSLTGTASSNAPVVAKLLLGYVLGSTSASKDGLDGILSALTDRWKGAAADAFAAQAATVRTFAIGAATLMDKSVNTMATGVQLPQYMQYELQNMVDYGTAMAALNTALAATNVKYKATNGDYTSWIQYLDNIVGHTQNDLRTTNAGSDHTDITYAVPTFQDWCDGRHGGVEFNDYGWWDPRDWWQTAGMSSSVSVDAAKQKGLNASLRLVSGFDPNTAEAKTNITYVNNLTGASFWGGLGNSSTDDQNNQNLLSSWAVEPEKNVYLRNLIVELGRHYPTVVAPQAQDPSRLPKGANPPATNQNQNQNGGGSGWNPGSTPPFNGTVPGSTIPSTTPGSLNPGGAPGSGGLAALTPGSTTPGSLAPGSYTPGSTDPGVWDPSKLAGFNGGSGGGLGSLAPGFGTGTGAGGFNPGGLGSSAGDSALGGVGGLAAGAGDAGLAGAGAGMAGAPGRGMPMMPMGGMGGGKDDKERQRVVLLTEDDDVWGAGGDDAPAVL